MRFLSRARAVAVATAAALAASLLALSAPVAANAADDASISGVVTGGYISVGEGEAVAYRNAGGTWQQQSVATIDATGSYTISGLPAGEYLVSFSEFGGTEIDGDGTEYRWWREWWNDWMDSTAAASSSGSIVLAEGEHRTGVDGDVDSVEGQYTWPDITGVAKVGYTLTATPGAWPAGTSDLLFGWYADGNWFAFTQTGRVTLGAGQLGKRISVQVWGVKPSAPGTFEVKDGNVTGKVVAGTLKASTPKISGTAKVGKKLTAKPGVWTSGTKFTYRWYANGKAIKKATKSTFKVTSAQRGKKITVKVTGTKAGYTTVAKVSAKTKKVKR